MSKTTMVKNQPPKKTKRQELLRAVPYESGFHFYIGLGKYAGVTATSLDEFAGKLQTVPVESITFHFQRGDFQKWLGNTIGDDELAKRIYQLKQGPSWSSDENLRKELVKTVQKRLAELRPLL
jgi:alpha-amylase